MSICTFDPREMLCIGMAHCPYCGEMVLGGYPHPDYDRPFDESDYAIIEGRACKWHPGYHGEDSAKSDTTSDDRPPDF